MNLNNLRNERKTILKNLETEKDKTKLLIMIRRVQEIDRLTFLNSDFDTE